jgi:hypothetical protein
MAVQSQIVAPLVQSGVTGTAFAGPVVTGNREGQGVTGVGPNLGLAVCMQQVTLNANAANAVSVTTYLPRHSVLIDVLADTLTAWNSATSDTLSVGTAAAGTQYVSGVDVKTAAGRQRPTFTAAQLSAMLDTGSNEAIVATVTPVGSAAAGQTVVTYVYVQTVNWQNP